MQMFKAPCHMVFVSLEKEHQIAHSQPRATWSLIQVNESDTPNGKLQALVSVNDTGGAVCTRATPSV